MQLIEETNGCEIWESKEDYGHGPVSEFFVYGVTLCGDPRTFPSLAMAREVVAGW